MACAQEEKAVNQKPADTFVPAGFLFGVVTERRSSPQADLSFAELLQKRLGSRGKAPGRHPQMPKSLNRKKSAGEGSHFMLYI